MYQVETSVNRKKYTPIKGSTAVDQAYDGYVSTLRSADPGTKVRIRNTSSGKVLRKGEVT